MKERLKIASKLCRNCNGYISWDQKINNRFPVHVDKDGYIIGDGSCPKFRRASYSGQHDTVSLFETQEFNRFSISEEDENYTLPLFQDKKPLIPRFYIGKIALDLIVYKKIIRIPPLFHRYNIWGLAHRLVRGLLQQKKIFSFFKIIESDEEEDKFIHLYIVPHKQFNLLEFDPFIVEILSKAVSDVEFKEDLIINKEFNEEVITSENIFNYVRHIKVFFDALTYRAKFIMKDGEYNTTIYHDLIGNDLYYYVDIDAIFTGKGSPATREDVGKFIFGELKDKNKKYRLIKITSSPITTHLDDDEEYPKFLEFSRTNFENKGYPRKKDTQNDWSLKDYWGKINEVTLPENDIITIVQGSNEKNLYFPLSRLFKIEKKDIPRDIRFREIQNAKQFLLEVLKEYKEALKQYSSSVNILLLEQVVPKYYDLAKYPMHVEFANDQAIQLQRNEKNHDQLNIIPQELLKNKSNQYRPIAGEFNFLLVPIVPVNITEKETIGVEKLINDIVYSLRIYHLSNHVDVGDYIKYEFNRDDIFRRKQNKWGVVFDKQISPKLVLINEKIVNQDVIVLPLIGLRELGTSSKLFKYYFQNEFYRLLKAKLSINHFGIIQSFLIGDYKQYKGSKLAVMLYKNSLFNIAANCPHSEIAKRIKNGILFKFKYPFGTKDITLPLESIEMQAGFDASKVWGVEDSKPRGAVVVTLDPYGKQVRSKYIRDARTHKGHISESVIKDLVLEILYHQEQLISIGMKTQPELPKKIIFLFDGDINNSQKDIFIKVYKELIESGEYPMLPEFFIFEVLKSHPIRMYLFKGSNVYDIPFGIMALLNDNEFVIKSHIWSKRSMAQPQLYRFKLRLSQRFKAIERYSVLNAELEHVAVQLFQSTLFNTGKSGRPLKESFVIHESHKLSQEFASKADSIGVLFYKD